MKDSRIFASLAVSDIGWSSESTERGGFTFGTGMTSIGVERIHLSRRRCKSHIPDQ